MNAAQLERLGEHLLKLLAFKGWERLEAPGINRRRRRGSRRREDTGRGWPDR